MALRGQTAFRPVTVVDGGRAVGAALVLLTLAAGELEVRIEGAETYSRPRGSSRERVLAGLLTHALSVAGEVGATAIKTFIGGLGPPGGWPSSDTWYGAGDDDALVREVCRGHGLRAGRAAVIFSVPAVRLDGLPKAGEWSPAGLAPRLIGGRVAAGEDWLASITRAARCPEPLGCVWAAPDVGREVRLGRLARPPFGRRRSLIVVGLEGLEGVPRAAAARWLLGGLAAVSRPGDAECWFAAPAGEEWSGVRRELAMAGARPRRMREEFRTAAAGRSGGR